MSEAQILLGQAAGLSMTARAQSEIAEGINCTHHYTFTTFYMHTHLSSLSKGYIFSLVLFLHPVPKDPISSKEA